MSLSPANAHASPPEPKHPVLILLALNFVYLWAVHAWSLNITALGRDYATMALPQFLPRLTRWPLKAMLAAFGEHPQGYHVINVLLLYGCMVGVFFLTKALLQGPWWLGSLTAVLMMANPLKGEAVFNLTGVQDLLPALLAIWGTVLTVWPFERGRGVFAMSGFALLMIAGLSAVEYAFAPIAAVCLYECRARRKGRRSWNLYVAAAVVTVVLLYKWSTLSEAISPENWDRSPNWGVSPTQAFLSIFLCIYPIGLQATTAMALLDGSLWASIAAIFVAIAWLALWRASKHPAVFFTGLAALILRLPVHSVDLVNMSGGGKMLLPVACVAIGFGALCQRVLEHPQWPRHVVFLTSMLCLVFFGLEYRSILAWKQASSMVSDFQARAQAAASDFVGYPIEKGTTYSQLDFALALEPDFQYFRDAPVCLSEAVAYSTPFSIFIPARPVVRMAYPPQGQVELRWQGDKFPNAVEVRGSSMEELLPSHRREQKPLVADQATRWDETRDGTRVQFSWDGWNAPRSVEYIALRTEAAK